METTLIDALMARVTHRPLSRPLVPGVDVKTPRGYGVVVGEYRTAHVGGDGKWEPEACDGIIVALERGSNTLFQVRDLQVIE